MILFSLFESNINNRILLFVEGKKLPKSFPVDRFQLDLINWYHENHRSLPWRETKNPYHIWISEIMLQQTQVKTASQYYLRFINKFPTVEILSCASTEQVLKYWEGLGYYNRAIKLHQTAQIIMDKFQGNLPGEFEQLIDLPGIGPYTAGAIASFAFNQPEPAIDGNVARVISRIFLITEDTKKTKTIKKIREFALKILPREDAGMFNQAIMELGAIACMPRQPVCSKCPVDYLCKAFLHNKQDIIPNLAKKTKPKKLTMEMALISKENKLLLVKRPSGGLLANMWALPSTEKIKEYTGGDSIKSVLENAYQILINKKPVFIGEVKHVFTHLVWLMKLYHFPSFSEVNLDLQREKWISISQLNTYAIPVAFKKLLSYLNHTEIK